MAASIILTSEQFTYMQSYKPLASNRKEQALIKRELLEEVKKALGDLYYRLKQGTKDGLDKLAFLATDRGFAFISYDSLSEQLDVSRRTIERVIKQLKELGVLTIVYRRNPKGNSVKNPVVMFNAHKYFSYWNEYLGLATATYDVENDVHHDVEESSENVSSSKGGDVKKVATYALPVTTELKELNNRKENGIEHLENEYIFQDIPNEVQIRLAAFTGKEINAIWKRSVWAYRNSDIDAKITMTLQQLCRINSNIECRLGYMLAGCVLKYKQGEIRGALYGYVYTAALNFFNNLQIEACEQYEEQYKEQHVDETIEDFEQGLYAVLEQHIRRKAAGHYDELPY